MSSSKLIFRRLLEKLTQNCVFSVNNQLVKQVEGCPMGGAISVIMSGIHMNRMEKYRVVPFKPKLYRRYVDDTISKRKKNTEFDELYHQMNSHHPNIKLTIESNPSRFLDTSFSINPDGSVTTKVFRKPGKLPTFWHSQIPKRYKRNNIRGDLHRAYKIASDFDAEVVIITQKYLQVGYPIGFIKSVINDFRISIIQEETIIPEWLFDERCKVLFKLPYCPNNERDVKSFINKIETFTNGKYQFIVLWSTRNIKTLFPLKDKVKHLSCVIYEGICSCGKKYIGETKRNSVTRWNEHESKTGKSEPTKHLANNTLHKFTWKVLALAPKHYRKRKILEAFFIAKFKPDLNDQIEHHALSLFRHGVT